MSELEPCPACRRHVRIGTIACVFCAALVGCKKSDEAKPAPAPPPMTAPAPAADAGPTPTPPPVPAIADAGVPDDAALDAAVDAGVPPDAAAPGSVKKHGIRRRDINQSLDRGDLRDVRIQRPPKPYGAPPARRRIV